MQFNFARKALNFNWIFFGSLLATSAGFAAWFVFPQHYFVLGFLTSEFGTFDDFFSDRAEDFESYELLGGTPGANPPLATAIGFFWGLLAPQTALVLFSVGTVAVSLVMLSGLRANWAHLGFFLISYPVLFAVSRGNNDLYLAPILLLFALFMQRGKFGLAAATVGLATAMEPVMLPFVIIPFLQKKLLTFLSFSVTSSMLWATPLLFGERDLGVYVNSFQTLLGYYRENYVIGDGGLLFSNSAWGSFKTATMLLAGLQEVQLRTLFESVYVIYPLFFASAVITAIILLHSGLSWQRATAFLALVVVVFGPVSATYKLVILVVSLLVVYLGGDSLRRVEVVLWILVLSPKSLIVVTTQEGLPVTLDSLVNPILMLACMILLVLSEGHPRSGLFGELRPGIVASAKLSVPRRA